MKPGSAGKVVTARRRVKTDKIHSVSAQRCECGKVETDEPLAMCENCPECNAKMHTRSDVLLHETCGMSEAVEVPAPRSKRANTEVRKADIAPETTTGRPSELLCWEVFFYCQPNPVLRSQLLTCLLAGNRLLLDHIPMIMSLDAILISFTARTYCEAEIIDDFQGLLDRTEEEWRQPTFTHRVFDSMHGSAANWVIKGSQEFGCPEEQYIPRMVQWYLEHDVPAYFVRELETDADVKKHRKAARV
jgi:hypothetical protein